MTHDPQTSSRTCQAAVFVGADKPLVLQTFPLPEVAADEALIRVECCTLCGSDLHTMTGARQEAVPSILGHEAVGVVTEVGMPPLCDIDGVPLRIGDRVTWSVAVSCGSCDRCQRGLKQKCRHVTKYGHELAEGREALSGGLAEVILLRAGTAVVRLDEKTPGNVICPVNCATATVAAAFRVGGEVSNRRVLIFGAGMLGLTAAALAKSRGADHVSVCDRIPARLGHARRFGADCVVEWNVNVNAFRRGLSGAGGPESFDLILEASGSPDVVEAACGLGDVGATIILIGTVMPTRSVSLDPEAIVRGWLSIHGVHNYAPEDLRTAVEFLNRNHSRYPFADLVERNWSLENVNDAIQNAADSRPGPCGHSTVRSKTMPNVNDIIELFDTRGDSEYGGEAVTQLEHALQAASLAEREGATPSLIAAALLHDVGHLVHDLPDDAPDQGVDDHHESAGGNFLRQLFPESVTEPVRLHVAAKRYLCATDGEYRNALSRPSTVSLELQGGAMTDDEVEQFQANPFADDAVCLRRWDDAAKVPGLTTPPLTHFAAILHAAAEMKDE